MRFSIIVITIIFSIAATALATLFVVSF